MVVEGVVTANDTAMRRLTLRELGGDLETVISYDATAKMTDKYGEERDGTDIEVGEILEADYEQDSGKRFLPVFRRISGNIRRLAIISLTVRRAVFHLQTANTSIHNIRCFRRTVRRST